MLELDISKPYIFSKVKSDKRRMVQIMLNFLSNSLKFTNDGGFVKIQLKVLQE
jgi:two-component system, sensor histidine kinase and response regulator